MMLNKAFLSIIIFLAYVYKSSAIHCFYCNSANNSACIDPIQFDEETRAKLIPMVNCDTAVPMVKPINFFCRKIVQIINRPHHEAELRITRGCGWVIDEKPCYQAYSHDYAETVCQCFTNFCNDADNMDSNTTTVLFIAIAAYLYVFV